MTASDPISATTYRCFISYRHADNHTDGRRWATWLHQRLEKYPVPPSLVGTTNLRGKPVPRSIFPVFRDEDELPADADLSTPILRALDHSLGMVVICSPRARASRFVDDEVRLYKRATRGERILGLIIAGTPDTAGQAEDTCFPRAYLHRTDQAGQVLPEAELPLNLVDLRTHDGQEGWTDEEHHRAALTAAGVDEIEEDVAVDGFTSHLEEQFLVVVAHVLEVPAATLAEHHHRYQAELGRARLRSRLIWGSALLLLALAAWQGIRLSVEQGAAAGAATQAADAQSQQALERKTQLEAEERRTRAAQAESDYAQALAQQSLPSSSVQLIEEKIRSAAGLGHVPAQVALGQRLQGRPGGPEEAIDWFTKAAKQGHAPAMEALGLAYRDGRGVAADRAQRTLGKIGPLMIGMTLVSCVAFLLIPFFAHLGAVVALGLMLIWVVTSSALRAPPWVLLSKYAAAPSVPRLNTLLLCGLAAGGAVAPYLGITLKNVPLLNSEWVNCGHIYHLLRLN